MRKKLLSLGLLSAAILAFVGCSSKPGTGDKAENTAPTYTIEELSTIATTAAATEAEKEEVYGEGSIIKGGDFEDGTGSWTSYKNGGSVEMAVNDDKELQVDIASIGSVEHGVQIYYDGFAIRQGGVYEVSFDIHGTLERPVDWRIQVNGGDYHAYVMDTVTLSKEVQHVSAQFTMEEETDPAPRFCFNMGLVDSLAEQGVTELPEHSIMIDNVSLIVVDATNMIKDPDPVPVPLVKVNQEGYTTAGEKRAVFSDLDEQDNKYMIVDTTNDQVVFTGAMSEVTINVATKEHMSYADFSALQTPGTYIVRTIGNAESHPFTISDDVYADTFANVVKMLYLQRCGTELSADLAGDFAHPVCHNTEAVIFGTNTKIDVSGGWHDAGDYGRYVVSGAKTVADMLLSYERNPEAYS
ncbi:MAG: glycoside hydrolase family 9 protein, partial [Lachnospiraceae bacterium]|nr:glycoside hydrolase family 9 protein [Lachnospiraceae bacterium]